MIERLPALQSMLLEHLLHLTVLPIFLAVCVSVPLAIAVRHRPVLRSVALGASGVVQTIPSLAMLAFLLPLCGIGKTSAMVALTLYAMLPILQNTMTALRELPASVLEAADGIGFSSTQRLFMIEIPLALPLMLGGLRTATTICVGVATLSTFIGAGGLGDFINRGLSLNHMPLILLGAGTAAGLALMLDHIIEWIGMEFRAGKRPPQLHLRRGVGILLCGLLMTCLLWPMGRVQHAASSSSDQIPIRIGSKNFTEQLILGELLAQWIEHETSLPVERVFNLGGTVVCHQALAHDELDVYVEYSGTALMTVLNQPLDPEVDSDRMLSNIREQYHQQFHCEILSPLGFNNTYSLAVRKTDAALNQWKTIRDLATSHQFLRGGFTSEFMERPDGLPGLVKTYGLKFERLNDLGPDLMYQALANHQVDVISAFSTDGQMIEFDLTALEDDLEYFPPYEAIPIAREAVLRDHPELRVALQRLGNRINNDQMVLLNFEVQVQKKDPADVVSQFIEQLHLSNPQ